MDELSMEEIFADAVDKLQRGEGLEKIIRGYPTEKQLELSQLLEIVEIAEQLATMPVPQPSIVRRDSARSAFLVMAAAKRAALDDAVIAPLIAPALVAGAVTTPASATATKSSTASTAPATGIRALIDQARTWLDEAFRSPSLRLAPLAILLLVVSIMGLWVTAAARDSGPNDPLHGLKEWSLGQQLSLAPDSVRAEVIRKIEASAKSDLEKVAVSDRNELVSEVSTRQIYYGTEGNLLQVGPFFVRPGYQEDANNDALSPMVQRGELAPGVTVDLTYRTFPGNPAVVQGVSLVVVDGVKSTPEPTAQPTVSADCQIDLPKGWVPYAVRTNDTLESLAERSNVSAERILAVNCISKIEPKDTIYLPAAVYGRGVVTHDTAPEPWPIFVRPIATYTPVIEPGEESTEPPYEPPTGGTPVPTGEAPDVPTEAPTGVTEAPTGVATDVPTEAPTGVATDTPTDAPTGVPTDAPTGVPTDAPTGVPTDAPTGVPTDAPTGVPTDAPTGVPTDAPTGVPTDAPTEAPQVAPTTTAPDVPTSAPTEEYSPPDIPTEAPTEEYVPPDVPTEEYSPPDVPTDAATEEYVPPDVPTEVYEPPADVPTDAPSYDPPTSEPIVAPEAPSYDPPDVPTYEPPADPPVDAPPVDTPSP